MADMKCLNCGKKITGTSFYCDGCSQYVCWDCAQVKDDQRVCPSCGTELQEFTI